MLNTTRRHRWGIVLGAAAIAAASMGIATPAMGYGWHGGGGWGGGGWRGYWPGIGLGFGYYPAPYAYGPPVYYAPPAYYPQPSYYYPSYTSVAPYAVPSAPVRHHVRHKAAAKPSVNCPLPNQN
jgi:hypothetical protein